MPSGFFRAVWRFNALAIAVCGVIGVFVGLFAAFHIAREVFRRPYQATDVAHAPPAKTGDKTGDTSNNPKTQIAVKVGHFTRMRGTPLMLAHVNATETYDFSYASKEAASTRNLVFYDTNSGASRRLLPDDARLILSTTELRGETETPDQAPQALLFRLIESDSNRDGLLNSKDQVTLALSRIDGAELTRIDLPTAADTRGQTLAADGKTAVVMTGSGPDVQALHIDLTTFKVTKTDRLTQ